MEDNEEKRKQQREGQRRWRESNREKDRQNSRTWYKNNKATKAAYKNTLPVKYREYKHNAKKRGHDFSLTFEDFCAITETKECYYCGESGPVGIDRFDNSKGYTAEPGQCVPCCTWCNVAKADGSFAEMLDRLWGVVSKHGNKC
jgi:hypothetical protein